LKCFWRYVFIAASRAGSAATLAIFGAPDAAVCAEAFEVPATTVIAANKSVSEVRARARQIRIRYPKYRFA
jgi:hypothetical protein